MRRILQSSVRPFFLVLCVALLAAPAALAHDHPKEHAHDVAEGCKHFGPQTPRDIDSKKGTNPVVFPEALPSTALNLCNMHYHVNAENRSAAFSIPAEGGEDGIGGGFRCGISESLSADELAAYEGNACRKTKPGDTIEMHWVYTSCEVAPGPGLGSCLSDACANPSLRVETQVFTLVNDRDALDFADFAYAGGKVNGKYQPPALPTGTGTPVNFLGSTTGPSFSEETCSPLQVSWSVRPECAKLDIASLSAWCADNVFDESKAHGVRALVENPALLSAID
ncbi:MAG: delta-class carbonic anhydrase [Acidobacteriota bacterium]